MDRESWNPALNTTAEMVSYHSGLGRFALGRQRVTRKLRRARPFCWPVAQRRSEGEGLAAGGQTAWPCRSSAGNLLRRLRLVAQSLRR